MDIKRYDFDYRIAEVMPMLEEKQLYGTKALIRDLKTVVDKIQEIRAKAIDEFTEKIQWEYLNSCGLKQREIDFLVAVSSMVAEQMKVGGIDG